MVRGHVLAAAATLALGAAVELTAARAAQAQPALGDYAVLGVDAVRIGAAARIRSGAVGALGTEVVLGRRVRVAGTVAGDTIRLRAGADAGRLFCRLVVGPAVAGSALPLCRAFTPPLVDPALLPLPQVVAGTDPLRIRRRTGTAPLPPGSFADVVVGPGALLQLAGGTYAARSIRVAPGGRLVCTSACEIGVQVSVLLARAAQLGAATATQAESVRVNVVGEGATRAVRARMGAVIAANVYAPGGDIVLGARGSYRGAYVGRSVRLGTNAEVREDSAL